MTKTVEAKEIGLDPIEVSNSIGMQKKVAEAQKKIAKISSESQDGFTKAMRDANIISQLDKNKAEDVRSMERFLKEYDIDLGPFDKDLWSMYDEMLSAKLGWKISSLSDTVTPEVQLKMIQVQLDLIEELAGISTKTKKEKFENSDLLTNESVQTVYSRLIRAIMNIPEDVEETEEDSKSNS